MSSYFVNYTKFNSSSFYLKMDLTWEVSFLWHRTKLLFQMHSGTLNLSHMRQSILRKNRPGLKLNGWQSPKIVFQVRQLPTLLNGSLRPVFDKKLEYQFCWPDSNWDWEIVAIVIGLGFQHYCLYLATGKNLHM